MAKKKTFHYLFQPGYIGQMEVRNRIVVPPMVTNFGERDGSANDRLKYYVEARARGGVGLHIFESSCVDFPVGRITGGQTRIDNDNCIAGFRKITRAAHKHGAKIAIQINHSGAAARSAITGMRPVGPSAIPRTPGAEVPQELSVGEIDEIVRRFGAAGRRAQEAGFDGVEIHAAGVYLIQEFLSRAWNKRADRYGGSLKNRARFPIEVIKAIRQEVGPDFPVWFRIIAWEPGIEDGITPEEAEEFSLLFQKAGSDAINVSAQSGSGPYFRFHRAPMYDPPGQIVPLAERIKKVVNIPIMAVGRLDARLGEEVLREGKADFVNLGRATIADPELPNKARRGDVEDITPCLACNWCADNMLTFDIPITCSVNATVGREKECTLKPARQAKKVLVIGGGPAGMEAARVAALRGHQVYLSEQKRQLGGQMVLAAVPPGKQRIGLFTDYLKRQLKKRGVTVKLGGEVTPEIIKKLAPQVVLLATGAVPVRPRIPGIKADNVVIAEDVLQGKVMLGQNVVIIGGGLVGCETAEFIADAGKKVIVVEMLDTVMSTGVVVSIRQYLLTRLAQKGVTLLTGITVKQINARSVSVVAKDGSSQSLAADTVVLAAGYRPNNALLREIKGIVPEVYPVGDCVEARNIPRSVADGYDAGSKV